MILDILRQKVKEVVNPQPLEGIVTLNGLPIDQAYVDRFKAIKEDAGYLVITIGDQTMRLDVETFVNGFALSTIMTEDLIKKVQFAGGVDKRGGYKKTFEFDGLKEFELAVYPSSFSIETLSIPKNKTELLARTTSRYNLDAMDEMTVYKSLVVKDYLSVGYRSWILSLKETDDHKEYIDLWLSNLPYPTHYQTDTNGRIIFASPQQFDPR